MAENRSKPDQYQLRFPPGLRDRLKAAGDSRARSMNAEIIARLEGSFRGWPKITLNEDLFERVKKAPLDKRRAMEKEIEEFTIKVVERELPARHELHRDMYNAFLHLLHQAPEENRDVLREQFNALYNGLTTPAKNVAKG